MDRMRFSTLSTSSRCGDSLPHICFVAPHAWPVLSGSRQIALVGGAEVQQCHIARGLVARGYRVSMLCLDYGQPAQVEVDGVVVRRLYRPEAGLPVLRFLHPRLTSLWSGMRKVNADIYYQRGADMHTGVVAAFCRRHGKQSVFAAASDADFMPDKLWIQYARDRWLYEYGLSHAGAVVAQNAVQQQLCRENYRRDATLIRSCYPATGAHADPAGSVLWVGAIRTIKSPERFIDLARALPEHRFTMIGGPGGADDESRRYYEAIRRQAIALPNLQFLGFVHPADIEQHFDRARIFVNTSDIEGFPNTFLQAWARRIPTVSLFDSGSMEDGQAVCITARDMHSMIDPVRTLSRDDVKWRDAGERCWRHFVRNHSLDSVLDAYEGLFGNFLEAAHSTTP